MSHYIGIYIKTCDLCNQMKVQHRRPIGMLHPTETPEAPWDVISVDFIVELPKSHGYDAIMNVVDSVTKRTVMSHKCLTPKSVTIRSYMHQK
jgi:hypothetical protein